MHKFENSFKWLSEHRFIDRMAEIHFEEVDNTAENMTDEEKQMRKVQGEIDLLKKVASESLEKVRYFDITFCRL